MKVNRTCVILDDDPLMVKVLESIIKKDDRLTHLASYTKAHDAIFDSVRLDPDILFLDINIPLLDGLEVMKVLEYKRPTTIVVSSEIERFKEFEDIKEVVCCIPKPINKEEFNKAVEKALLI